MIGSLPVGGIDVGLVMKVLEPIWTTKVETASRLRGRIEQVLSWATVRGYRMGDNPARWKGHLDQLLPARGKVRKVKHHASLPYAELPAFCTALQACEGVGARALEFAILTACRTGDIIGNDREDKPPMRWPHVDLDNRVWTIPATKNGSEHKVPLAPAAVALLRAVKALKLDDDLVFPSTDRWGSTVEVARPLSNGAMPAVLDRLHRDDVTVHGFRATFKTWASERTNFAREVVEAALAHTISDALEAAYRGGDFFNKRRRLMEAWANYCNSARHVSTDKGVAIR